MPDIYDYSINLSATPAPGWSYSVILYTGEEDEIEDELIEGAELVASGCCESYPDASKAAFKAMQAHRRGEVI